MPSKYNFMKLEIHQSKNILLMYIIFYLHLLHKLKMTDTTEKYVDYNHIVSAKIQRNEVFLGLTVIQLYASKFKQ